MQPQLPCRQPAPPPACVHGSIGRSSPPGHGPSRAGHRGRPRGRVSRDGHDGGRDRGDALAAAGQAEPVGGGAADRHGRAHGIRERRLASTRRRPTLGRLPMTCTATLPMSKPASRTSRAASASRVAPDAPASSGRPVPKCAPRSPMPAAEKSASQAAWAATSPSEWPSSPRSPGPEQPGDPQLAPGPVGRRTRARRPRCRPWAVRSWRQSGRRSAAAAARWASTRSACSRSSRVVTLNASGSPSTTTTWWPPSSTSAASSVAHDAAAVGRDEHARARSPAGSAPRAATRGRGCR